MKTKNNITRQNIIKELIRSKQKIGKIPTVNQYDEHHIYGSSSWIQKNGGWKNTCKIAFGYTPFDNYGTTQLQCKNCNKKIIRNNGQIKKNKSGNFFCSHSCAAFYSNSHKTKGTNVSKIQKYFHKKLYELYPCLEFYFNKISAINAELDIYIPKLKLAFQINGIFHYQPIYGQEKLNKMKTNDLKKIQLCKQNNIQLITIDISKLKKFKHKQADQYFQIIKNKINSVYTRKDDQITIDRSIQEIQIKQGKKVKQYQVCQNCEEQFFSDRKKQRFCCVQCTITFQQNNGYFTLKHKNIPSKEQLMKHLQTKSYAQTARIYNVFGMTIRQWCIKLGISIEWVKQQRLKSSNYKNQYFK